jgi:hypothetical protein
MPRFVVVPASAVVRWKLEGTAIVQGTLNGMPLGRRSLKRWDEGRWFVDLRDDWCRGARITAGDRADLVLEIAPAQQPQELVKVLSESATARKCWDGMTASQRRIVREDVLAAKRPETRERREVELTDPDGNRFRIGERKE